MLVTVSACFYTLFLFEILGDAVGLKDSFWTLIVVPTIPVYLYMFYWIYTIFTASTGDKDRNSTEIGIEIQCVGSANGLHNETFNAILTAENNQP